MKQRNILFAPEARDDLLTLYHWISDKAGADIAINYIGRIEEFCNNFDIASERGHSRDDIRQGLRIVGFEKRLTIAFIVSDQAVTFLRIFYGGQNWEDNL